MVEVLICQRVVGSDRLPFPLLREWITTQNNLRPEPLCCLASLLEGYVVWAGEFAVWQSDREISSGKCRRSAR